MSQEKKVVLAFSGGLDTTFCVIYLQEQGYQVITATINTGGFSRQELADIEKKSRSLGAVKHYTIDAQEKIYAQIIQYVIKLNGLYEDDYPLMCADRYIIAEEIVKIAKLEQTDHVAHGSTSNGNDQVRFDASFLTLSKEINIITPIKSLDISREEEIRFLQQHNIAVDYKAKKYSINQNVFGTTYSGSEIDEELEPDSEIYQLSRKAPHIDHQSSQYLELEFDQGLPVSLDRQKLSGLEILKKLDQLSGAFGFGARIYAGDCIIGIKGRLLFEAPGLFTLIEAHRKLEQYTLTRQQIAFNQLVRQKWVDLAYSGLYYEPLARNLEAYTDSSQARVCGQVKIKLQHNSMQVVQVSSPNSLINADIATYAQKGSWSAEEANGFIKLYGLQQKIAGQT